MRGRRVRISGQSVQKTAEFRTRFVCCPEETAETAPCNVCCTRVGLCKRQSRTTYAGLRRLPGIERLLGQHGEKDFAFLGRKPMAKRISREQAGVGNHPCGGLRFR